MSEIGIGAGKNTVILIDLISTTKNPDDIVITLAIRTPLTKAFKGGFKDTPLDGIIVKILKQVVARANIDPALVEDICLGNVSIRKHFILFIRK